MSQYIDIPYGKLREWLVSRHQLPSNSLTLLKGVQATVKQSVAQHYTTSGAKAADAFPRLKDLEVERFLKRRLDSPTASLSSLHYLDSQHILELLLAGPEADQKNFIGLYTSPHIKLWKSITSAYRYKYIFLSELHSDLSQLVSYDAPAIKRAIDLDLKTISDLDKKIKDSASTDVETNATRVYLLQCSKHSIPSAVVVDSSHFSDIQIEMCPSPPSFPCNLYPLCSSAGVAASQLSVLQGLAELAEYYENHLLRYVRSALPDAFSAVTSILKVYGLSLIEYYTAVASESSPASNKGKTVTRGKASAEESCIVEDIFCVSSLVIRAGNVPLKNALRTDKDFAETYRTCCPDIGVEGNTRLGGDVIRVETEGSNEICECSKTGSNSGIIEWNVTENGSAATPEQPFSQNTAVDAQSDSSSSERLLDNHVCRQMLTTELCEMFSFLIHRLSSTSHAVQQMCLEAAQCASTVDLDRLLHAKKDCAYDITHICKTKPQLPSWTDTVGSVEQRLAITMDMIFVWAVICKFLVEKMTAPESLDMFLLESDSKLRMKIVNQLLLLHWNCLKPAYTQRQLQQNKIQLEKQVTDQQNRLGDIRKEVQSMKKECEETVAKLFGKKVRLIGDISRI
eukprot:GHVQ01005154.1.p1 GENE.GHVQ01005154.1~~GHVQ01005154.1.p1  ORF type:complete len:625 (+),score=73.15 GHVQ01005154.1:703-2577(+)